MCPSFSLWACRILKMRSCLRRPLAPGSSRDRAMRVNSVMFFSLSSEIVMFTYGDFAEGRAGGTYEEGAKGATRLCSAPLAFGSSLRFYDHITTVRVSNAIQYLIRRV